MLSINTEVKGTDAVVALESDSGLQFFGVFVELEFLATVRSYDPLAVLGERYFLYHFICGEAIFLVDVVKMRLFAAENGLQLVPLIDVDRFICTDGNQWLALRAVLEFVQVRASRQP